MNQPISPIERGYVKRFLRTLESSQILPQLEALPALTDLERATFLQLSGRLNVVRTGSAQPLETIREAEGLMREIEDFINVIRQRHQGHG